MKTTEVICIVMIGLIIFGLGFGLGISAIKVCH